MHSQQDSWLRFRLLLYDNFRAKLTVTQLDWKVNVCVLQRSFYS